MRIWMKRGLILLLFAMVLASCGKAPAEKPAETGAAFQTVTAEEGKAMLEEDPVIILLDVRTPEEFAEGHIAGAIRITDSELEAEAPRQLPDKDAKILIYCRSGRRSRASAQKLVDMGYTQVYDMGGIIDWPYEIVK